MAPDYDADVVRSAYPTASEKNPTLTIMAPSWRATDNLAELIRSSEA